MKKLWLPQIHLRNYKMPPSIADILRRHLCHLGNKEACFRLALVILCMHGAKASSKSYTFKLDRRAISAADWSELSESRVRGAIKALLEIDFVRKIHDPSAETYQMKAGMVQRCPLDYCFGGDIQKILSVIHASPKYRPKNK